MADDTTGAGPAGSTPSAVGFEHDVAVVERERAERVVVDGHDDDRVLVTNVVLERRVGLERPVGARGLGVVDIERRCPSTSSANSSRSSPVAITTTRAAAAVVAGAAAGAPSVGGAAAGAAPPDTVVAALSSYSLA